MRRSDGSGTTFVFTDYLTAVSSEFDVAVGKGKSVQWPARTHGAAGNEGVSGIIRSTEYTIGYVELAYAFQTGMSYAHVQNGDGTAFVEPTLDSISAASQTAAQTLPKPSGDWSEVSLVNTPGDNSYWAIVRNQLYVYLLVYDEIPKNLKRAGTGAVLDQHLQPLRGLERRADPERMTDQMLASSISCIRAPVPALLTLLSLISHHTPKDT